MANVLGILFRHSAILAMTYCKSADAVKSLLFDVQFNILSGAVIKFYFYICNGNCR